MYIGRALCIAAADATDTSSCTREGAREGAIDQSPNPSPHPEQEHSISITADQRRLIGEKLEMHCSNLEQSAESVRWIVFLVASLFYVFLLFDQTLDREEPGDYWRATLLSLTALMVPVVYQVYVYVCNNLPFSCFHSNPDLYIIEMTESRQSPDMKRSKDTITSEVNKSVSEVEDKHVPENSTEQNRIEEYSEDSIIVNPITIGSIVNPMCI